MDLVNRCGEREARSLNEFFTAFSEDIYNFPIKVFHLDEDAASDFFLYAYERLKDGARFRSFKGRSSFRTWFYTVLRNLVIDWMRTIREVNTVYFSNVDDKGNEFRMIENTPDPRSMEVFQDGAILGEFRQRLNELSVELRVIFKLSYIYYLDLDKDELEYLKERSGKTPRELMEFIADLKNTLAEKEIKNIGTEDKITSLYISILELKLKKEKIQAGAPPEGDESGEEEKPAIEEDSAESFELLKINRAIEKKYQQREKLLEKKVKGHFIVRTPYKNITELLGVPEGSVSVQMMRAMEKIRGKKGVES